MLRVFCMMNVGVVNVFGEHRDLFWICHPGLVPGSVIPDSFAVIPDLFRDLSYRTRSLSSRTRSLSSRTCSGICHPGLVPGSVIPDSFRDLSYVIRDPPDKRGMTMKEVALSKSMALLPSKFSALVCIPVTLLPHPVMLSFEKDKPRANLVC